MQSVKFSPPAARSRRRRTLGVAAAVAAAMAMVGSTAELALAACPWIVQPYGQSLQITSDTPAFDIVFDGLGQNSKVFYGFTVASLDLAWQLANQRTLPPMHVDARRLEPKMTAHGTLAYQLAPDSIQPHTIYLVASGSVVPELELIDARIEPARPLALSQLLPKTRGGTDWSGPLPHRSLPGFEIASVDDAGGSDTTSAFSAGIQICAYQVGLR